MLILGFHILQHTHCTNYYPFTQTVLSLLKVNHAITRKLKSKTKPDGSKRYRQHSYPHKSVGLHLAAGRIRLRADIQFHQSVLTASTLTARISSLPSPSVSICMANIVFSQRAFTGHER